MPIPENPSDKVKFGTDWYKSHGYVILEDYFKYSIEKAENVLIGRCIRPDDQDCVKDCYTNCEDCEFFNRKDWENAPWQSDFE